jgi:release factor glutamine methyltransferase
MKYFYRDIVLDVPDSVYYPREDSELIAKTIERTNMKNKKALEIGCGSGLLSIIMAKSGADVTTVDINPDAVEATKANAGKNGVKLDIFVSDMFEKVKGIFDLIVFNAPYLPDDTDLDVVAKIRGEKDINSLREKNIVRQWSGGPAGREVIEKFVSSVKNYLNDNGKILIGISSLTGEKEIIGLFGSIGMNAKTVARQKIPWEELIIIECENF